MSRTRSLAARLSRSRRPAVRAVVLDLAGARECRHYADTTARAGDARCFRRDAAGLIDRACRELAALLAAARGTRPALWT